MRISRTVIPDGERIVRLMIEAGWTITSLADQAIDGKGNPMAPGTIRSIIHSKPVFRTTLERIADVLDIPVKDIVSTRTSRHQRPASSLLEGGMAQAIEHDLKGESLQAIAIAELLLSQTSIEHIEQYATICIQLAAFYDHTEQWAKAIDLLDKVLERLNHEREKNDAHEELRCWAIYQKAINLLKMGEPAAAEGELLKILIGASLRPHRISALHQLGVIALKRGSYDSAKTMFDACISERTVQGNDRRLAFEYRRIGQVYALTDQREDAEIAFSRAMTIAQNCGFSRYVDLIHHDLSCLRTYVELQDTSAASKENLRRCLRI